MKIRALKAFTIRDSETGNLTSIAYGGIAEVSDTVGTSLISDGLAEAYTLVNPTGSVNITNNGTVDVAEYATAVVNVPGVIPTGTIEITNNGTVDVTEYATAEVNVPGVTPTGTIEITSNGTVDVTNYATAEVNVDYTTVNFYLSESIERTTTALSQARGELAATTVAPAWGSGYALFGGGNPGSAVGSAVVNAYDSSLTIRTSPPLSHARERLTATALAPTGGSNPKSGYALFAGGVGVINGYTADSAVVDACDADLTMRTRPTLSVARAWLAATTVAPAGGSGYALFGGGYNTAESAVVDAYDTDLEKATTPPPLSEARYNLAATTVAPAGGSGYALFGGGIYGSNVKSSAVDVYDSSLTKTTTTVLSQAMSSLAATTVAPAGGSGYALFGGGYNDAYLSVVDAYDSSLTRITPTVLSKARANLAATTVAITRGSNQQSVYALFGGGAYGLGINSSVVDVYDTSLTRTTTTALSQARRDLAATTLATTWGSGYALFGGGAYGLATKTSAVDVYGAPNYKVQVFPGTKYSFNGSEELVSDTWREINISGNLIGYLKIKSAQIN